MLRISKEMLDEATPTLDEGYYSIDETGFSRNDSYDDFIKANPYPFGSKQWRRWNYGKKVAIREVIAHLDRLVSGAVRDVKYMTMH